MSLYHERLNWDPSVSMKTIHYSEINGKMEDSLNGNNGYMTVTNASLVGGKEIISIHRLQISDNELFSSLGNDA